MVVLFRAFIFLLFGLLAASVDRRTLRIPHSISFGGLALLLLSGPPKAQLLALLWPLLSLGPVRLAMPYALGGGDLALSLMLAAYLGGPEWCEALLLSGLLLLFLSRFAGGTELLGPPRAYPFAPFLVSASVIRAAPGPLREAVIVLFGTVLFLLPVPGAFPIQESPPEIVEMEFRDQPIREILLVLAAATGRTIIPDRTVTGRASYFFSSIPLPAALEAFCEAYDLYLLPRESGITLVSRVRVRSAGGGSYSLDASDAPLRTVLQRLSVAAETPIRAGGIQEGPVSFHGGPLSLQDLLGALLADDPTVRVEQRDTHILLLHQETAGEGESPVSERALPVHAGGYRHGVELFREGEGRYSLSVRNGSLQEVLDLLFTAEKQSYLYAGGEDLPVRDLAMRDREFDEIVAAVLDQAGAEAREHPGYTEVLPLSGAGAPPVELSLPLHRWAPERLIRLLSGELLRDVVALPDEGRNRLLLSGAPEDVGRGACLVSAVDRRELEGTPFRAVQLRHTGAGELLLALPTRFEGFPIAPTPDDSAIVVALPPEPLEELRGFVELFDQEEAPHFYPLAALRGEEFVQRFGGGPGMPEIRSAPGDRGLLAWGKAGEIANLEEMLFTMDRPARQIRYDLLVLQRHRREGSAYDLTAEVDGDPGGGAVALSGLFDQLLTVRFDAISLLGHRLAGAISRGLAERSARLLADTTLYGLDGSEVAFTNTQTYRYRDLAYDEEKEKVLPTGVTREITSGIRLTVVGEVVEERQVRMRISAEYSKQGVELAEANDPPPTSEKRVETTVRTEEGKPIILAGLLQREKEEERRPVPILGRVPLLKRLFRPGRTDEEVMELVIYLVPHIDRTEEIGFPGTVEELIEALSPEESP